MKKIFGQLLLTISEMRRYQTLKKSKEKFDKFILREEKLRLKGDNYE